MNEVTYRYEGGGWLTLPAPPFLQLQLAAAARIKKRWWPAE
jgi:hypothetical protein